MPKSTKQIQLTSIPKQEV